MYASLYGALCFIRNSGCHSDLGIMPTTTSHQSMRCDHVLRLDPSSKLCVQYDAFVTALQREWIRTGSLITFLLRPLVLFLPSFLLFVINFGPEWLLFLPSVHLFRPSVLLFFLQFSSSFYSRITSWDSALPFIFVFQPADKIHFFMRCMSPLRPLHTLRYALLWCQSCTSRGQFPLCVSIVLRFGTRADNFTSYIVYPFTVVRFVLRRQASVGTSISSSRWGLLKNIILSPVICSSTTDLDVLLWFSDVGLLSITCYGLNTGPCAICAAVSPLFNTLPYIFCSTVWPFEFIKLSTLTTLTSANGSFSLALSVGSTIGITAHLSCIPFDRYSYIRSGISMTTRRPC